MNWQDPYDVPKHPDRAEPGDVRAYDDPWLDVFDPQLDRLVDWFGFGLDEGPGYQRLGQDTP